ncbi:hypothetical protein NQZ68_010330 [Dissostichus eleginoides]|nr:hypothetical protein NQZ68_010330 [Dissostichus eleginoides]
MLDGLSPTQDPVLAPSLSKDPVGPWMEQALVHVLNEEFCNCMAGIENDGVNFHSTGSLHAAKSSTDADQTHCRINLSLETLNLLLEAFCLAALQQEAFSVTQVRLRQGRYLRALWGQEATAIGQTGHVGMLDLESTDLVPPAQLLSCHGRGHLLLA